MIEIVIQFMTILSLSLSINHLFFRSIERIHGLVATILSSKNQKLLASSRPPLYYLNV